MGLSAAPANEFTRIAKEQGVSAALAWQKKRFAEVGAFASVSAPTGARRTERQRASPHGS